MAFPPVQPDGMAPPALRNAPGCLWIDYAQAAEGYAAFPASHKAMSARRTHEPPRRSVTAAIN